MKSKLQIGSFAVMAICFGTVLFMDHNAAPILTPTTLIVCALAICAAVVGGWS